MGYVIWPVLTSVIIFPSCLWFAFFSFRWLFLIEKCFFNSIFHQFLKRVYTNLSFGFLFPYYIINVQTVSYLRIILKSKTLSPVTDNRNFSWHDLCFSQLIQCLVFRDKLTLPVEPSKYQSSNRGKLHGGGQYLKAPNTSVQGLCTSSTKAEIQSRRPSMRLSNVQSGHQLTSLYLLIPTGYSEWSVRPLQTPDNSLCTCSPRSGSV